MYQVRYIIKSTQWLLTCLCVALLASCSFEDDDSMCYSDTVSLQITVTAREEGDLNSRASESRASESRASSLDLCREQPGVNEVNSRASESSASSLDLCREQPGVNEVNSRAAGDTETGTTSEFMNDHLMVYLVDANGQVALKLVPDLTSNPAAQQGNLKAWISDEITIETGTYTAYAFANIDDYYYTGWSSIISNISVGQTFDASAFNNVILDDPASKLNFADGHYIPMSATPLTVNVTKATTGISIGLDRLVSKVRTTIKANEGVVVKSFLFSGYADKVSLMSGATLPDDTEYSLSKTFTPNETVPTAGYITIDDFYINETIGNGFDVNITTNEGKDVYYAATTTTTEVPRNYIFPLTLQLNAIRLTLSATVYATPIGYYVPITAISGSAYEVTIPNGWAFKFGISLSGGITPTVTWAFAEDNTNHIYFDGTDNSQVTTVTATSVTGACLADETEGSYTINIDVEWTSGSNTYTRAYTLVVNVTNDWDDYWTLLQGSTTTAKGLVRYLNPEVLTLSDITK